MVDGPFLYCMTLSRGKQWENSLGGFSFFWDVQE